MAKDNNRMLGEIRLHRYSDVVEPGYYIVDKTRDNGRFIDAILYIIAKSHETLHCPRT